jgi:phage terminase small subunit
MTSKRKTAKARAAGNHRSRQPATAGRATKPSADPRSSAAPTAAKTTSATTRAKPGTGDGAYEARTAAFVEHYIANGGNGTQAAISAGYAEKSAHVAASRLLKDDKVAAAIAQRRDKALASLELTTDLVLLELARIVRFDPRKLYKPDGSMKAVHELDDDTAAAIASVELDSQGRPTKVRGWDKNGALANAMRHLGLMKPETPLIPPAPPGPTINAQNVIVMGPMEAYQRMLKVAAKHVGAD